MTRPAVLVVDDDEATTQTFARVLRLGGFGVETALGASGACRAVDREQFDAILLDLRMPQTDGLAFLRDLRSREGYRRVPVAIVTGDYFLDDRASREIAELHAALHFKPVWLEELLALVHSLTDTP
jgi:CheY-like chemotaxis protein